MGKQKKEAQYNELGELVYKVGASGVAGDVSGVNEPANKAEAECFKLLQATDGRQQSGAGLTSFASKAGRPAQLRLNRGKQAR